MRTRSRYACPALITGALVALPLLAPPAAAVESFSDASASLTGSSLTDLSTTTQTTSATSLSATPTVDVSPSPAPMQPLSPEPTPTATHLLLEPAGIVGPSTSSADADPVTMGPPTGVEDSAAAGGCSLNDPNACVPDDIDISPLMDQVTALAAAALHAANECLKDDSSVCNGARALAEEAVATAQAAAEQCVNDSSSVCNEAVAAAVLLADVVVSLGLGCVNGEVALCQDTYEAAGQAARDALQAANDCLSSDGSLCQQALQTVESAAGFVQQLVVELLNACLNNENGLCQETLRTGAQLVAQVADAAGDAAGECLNDSSSACQEAVDTAGESAGDGAAAVGDAVDQAGDIASQCLNDSSSTCQATLQLVLEIAGGGLRDVQAAVQACLADSGSLCQTALAIALAGVEQGLGTVGDVTGDIPSVRIDDLSANTVIDGVAGAEQVVAEASGCDSADTAVQVGSVVVCSGPADGLASEVDATVASDSTLVALADLASDLESGACDAGLSSNTTVAGFACLKYSGEEVTAEPLGEALMGLDVSRGPEEGFCEAPDCERNGDTSHFQTVAGAYGTCTESSRGKKTCKKFGNIRITYKVTFDGYLARITQFVVSSAGSRRALEEISASVFFRYFDSITHRYEDDHVPATHSWSASGIVKRNASMSDGNWRTGLRVRFAGVGKRNPSSFDGRWEASAQSSGWTCSGARNVPCQFSD